VKQHLNAPMINNQINVHTLFRGNCPGDLKGPFVSQFLYQPIQLGSLLIDQKYECPESLKNYMTDVSGFLHIWNGGNPSESIILKGGESRHLITIRDCANYIHLDQLWQPFYMTATWLLSNAPIGFTCPQRVGSKFISLGPVDLFDLMMNATKLAMNTAWAWKWNQMKMRPEEMAYQLHIKKTNPSQGINFSSVLMDSHEILNSIHDLSQNYLLPQAYPEGSPCHPAYPAGHAVVAGAMSTILKAWFDPMAEIPHRKKPNADGSGLQNYDDRLYVGEELDKMASNCSTFRNFAGIHFRSDMNGGIVLGEMVAIDVLQDFVGRYANQVKFTLKKRNGQTIEIKNY
jgi:hypothetical protein